MTATIEPIQTADGIRYKVVRVFPNWASAQRGKAELEAITPEGFAPYTPALEAGEPVDAPEVVAYVVRAGSLSDADMLALATAGPGEIMSLPPNCDFSSYGIAAAQAQMEAAVGEGDACSATGCVLKRDEP